MESVGMVVHRGWVAGGLLGLGGCVGHHRWSTRGPPRAGGFVATGRLWRTPYPPAVAVRKGSGRNGHAGWVVRHWLVAWCYGIGDVPPSS